MLAPKAPGLHFARGRNGHSVGVACVGNVIRRNVHPQALTHVGSRPEGGSGANAFAVASLWCGLGAVFLLAASLLFLSLFLLVVLPLSLAAVVLGFVARGRLRRSQEAKGEVRKAATGSVLGLSVLPAVLFLFLGSAGCLGQCSAPYLLNVNFRSGTSLTTAYSVIKKCGHNSIVTKLGDVESNSGTTSLAGSSHHMTTWQVQGQLWTKYCLRSPNTRPLLSCLEGSPSVQFAGWPV